MRTHTAPPFGTRWCSALRLVSLATPQRTWHLQRNRERQDGWGRQKEVQPSKKDRRGTKKGMQKKMKKRWQAHRPSLSRNRQDKQGTMVTAEEKPRAPRIGEQTESCGDVWGGNGVPHPRQRRSTGTNATEWGGWRTDAVKRQQRGRHATRRGGGWSAVGGVGPRGGEMSAGGGVVGGGGGG